MRIKSSAQIAYIGVFSENSNANRFISPPTLATTFGCDISYTKRFDKVFRNFTGSVFFSICMKYIYKEVFP